MKLRHRVLLAQLPLLLAVLGSLVFGGAAVQGLAQHGRDVLHENYRSVVAAQRMSEAIERLDSAALFHLAGRTEGLAAQVEEHRAVFEAELRVEEGNITEPGEREMTESLRARWARYQATHTRLMQADPAAAHTIYFAELFPEFQAVKADASRILELNQDAMVRKSDTAAERAQAMRRSWLFSSVIAIFGALALGAYVSRRLTGPLTTLSKTAEQVGAGQLDVTLPHSAVAELDAVANAFNTMADRLRLYRRAADSELARAREAAQAAIESLADPVLVLTLKGEVRATNGAARRVLGIDARARRLDACDPVLLAAVDTARESVVTEGRPVLPTDFARVVVVDSPEGERAFLPHATPINDAVTGELVGVTVLLQDVTRLRRLDELKGDLVQTVAHELRTPLTSLGMALHLALDERVSGPMAPKALELLVTAREDVSRLRALVEDLLDLSRIQEGRVVLRREPSSPAALLSEVRQGVAAEAVAAGVNLEIDASTDLPTVAIDRARMAVALTNLVSNALRYAPAGSTVLVRATAAGGGMRFEVDDAGPGVPKADREHIFEPFVRGESAPGRGAGLGLYIAREVARAHGGRIGVARADMGGARFWIEVPE